MQRGGAGYACPAGIGASSHSPLPLPLHVHHHRHSVHDSVNFLLRPEACSLRLAARLSKPANTGNAAADANRNDTDVAGDQRAHQVVVSRTWGHTDGQTALVDRAAGVLGFRVPRHALGVCANVDVQHDSHRDFSAVALAWCCLVLLVLRLDARTWGFGVRVHMENWRLILQNRSIRIPPVVVWRWFVVLGWIDVVNMNSN
ncbi:hypothetical protein F5141DRAFT_1079106 [Pisolithus sp. B1]|nr:hypothetical protein F5141DRAFT_1079106 [Pisolithus sp. B1]